jgi:hypothetical protein
MVTLYLAGWGTRFWAWLIDIILVGLPVSAVSDRLPPAWQVTVAPGLLSISLSSVVLFVYWTVLEGYGGRSIGKMALNVRVAGAFRGRYRVWRCRGREFREGVSPDPRLPDRVARHAGFKTEALQPDIRHDRD